LAIFISKTHARELTFEERVKAQEAIERVYYGHQIGATKPLDEVVPRSVLEKKVTTYLEKSVALARLWRTPVTAAMLNRELERIARDTRFPDRLKEVYSALGNDAFVIEECFARPTLVDRLARSFHGGGSLEPGDWDQWWSATAASIDDTLAPAVALGRSLPMPSSPDVSAASCPADDSWSTDGLWHLSPHTKGSIVWTGSVVIVWGGDGARTGGRYDPLIDVWTAMSVAGAPLTSDGSPAVWTGAEMIVSGSDAAHSGRYDPLSDTWLAVSVAGAPNCTTSHTAVWTGSRMIVWCGMAINGASYDPVADAWSPISLVGAPSQRDVSHAVWTGSEMIIWGGQVSFPIQNGRRYDPISDSWRSMSSTNGWSAGGDSAVWTGTAMIVWGGFTAHPPIDPGTYYNQGARYDPAADVWTPTTTVGAPTKRDKQVAVWAGNRMVIWGGENTFSWPQVGGRYDPSTDSWQPTGPGDPPISTVAVIGPSYVPAMGVSTGDRMFLWGLKSDRAEAGGQYDPSTDSWTPVSSWPGPSRREGHSALWTGSEMIVWGGQSGLTNPDTVTGGRFDPLTASWVPTSTSGIPLAAGGRSWPAAVWTGTEMVMWSGGNQYGPASGGGSYNPRTDTWRPMSNTGAPQPRLGPTAVWTGTKMIVWGGRDRRPSDTAYTHFATGGIYDPEADTWSATSTLGAPEARAFHTAVWTGTRMVIWGGGVIKPSTGSEVYFQTGGLYDPVTDAWSPTSLIGAPSARYDHTAVWTGLEMLTFGGRQIAPFGDGEAYDPVSDSWRALSPTSAPAARYQHTANWTGREMVVWGGSDGTTSLASGGRYFPGTDSWSATSTVGAPPGAQGHTAVWTGAMVAWGGREDGAISRDGGAYVLDVDGDGAGGACDCQPSDPNDRQPAEAGPLTLNKTGTVANLTWSAVNDTDAYSVTRGDLASKAADQYGTCQADGLPSSSYDDATVPPPGQGFFYLVQAQNYDCGLGSLGTTSSEEQRINSNPSACGGATVADGNASSESSVFGTVSGTFSNTQSSNNAYESMTEVLSSGGNPANRFSELEHRWTISVGSGTTKEVHVEGFRTSSTDGDDFRFEYSTNGGTSFTPVSMPSLPLADNEVDLIGVLPTSVVGSVIIRVVDTDRTAGHQALDTVSIDQLWIRVVP
jgi:N-acetylneuraminic acid mutarotase